MTKLLILLFIYGGIALTSVHANDTQDYYWRDYFDSCIPSDAVRAAAGVYIGQVNNEGNLPATIHPKELGAVATYGGKVNVTSPVVKIFCSDHPSRFYWELVNFSEKPSNQMEHAVVGGYQFNVKELMYIGKAMHEGEWKVGRVHTIYYTDFDRGLWVWNSAGEQVGIKKFYLLKYRPRIAKPKCKDN